MTEYMVEISSEFTYRMRTSSSESPKHVENEIWEQLEDDTDPTELGAYVWEAEIKHVRVRELYDWEKTP